MVVAPSFPRAEATRSRLLNAGTQRVAIGLHLTLTGPFKPLTHGYAPLADGAFLPLATTLRLRHAAAARHDGARGGIRAQFEAFADAFGRPPDFVDGHQHVHLFPQVRHAALEAASWMAPQAWVRQCGSALPLRRRLHRPEGPADRLAEPRIPRAAPRSSASPPIRPSPAPIRSAPMRISPRCFRHSSKACPKAGW